MSTEKDKALEVALGAIDKQFGKGSIMRMGEKQNLGIDFIPTGALPLDIALGIGGVPRGRIVEIFGPAFSGACGGGDGEDERGHGGRECAEREAVHGVRRMVFG